MRLQQVEFIGLFNQFDHSIKLNLDEHITILTAPNGYGKTTVLKVVNNFFSKNFQYFYDIPFKN